MKSKIRILIWGLGLFTIALFYFPVTSAVDRVIQNARDRLIHEVEMSLGRNFSFRRILPFLVQGIEIEDFVVTSSAGREVLRVQRLVLSYDLFGLLLRGDFPIDNILLQKASITLRSIEDQDIIDQVIQLISQKGGLPPITVIGEQVDLSLEFKEFDLSLKNLSFRFDNLIDYYNFTLNGEMIGSLKNEIPLTSFNASVFSKGRFDPAFQDANMEIDLREFDSNLFSFKSQSFKMTKLGSTYNIRTINNAQPYDLEFQFNLEKISWSMTVLSDRARLSNIFILKQIPRDWIPLFNAQFTGRFAASQEENLKYEGKGTLDFMNVSPFGRLSLQFDVKGVDSSLTLTDTFFKSANLDFLFNGQIDLSNKFKVDGDLEISRLLSPFDYLYSGKFNIMTRGEETLIKGTILDESVNSEITLNGSLIQESSFYVLKAKTEGFLNLEAETAFFPYTKVYSGSLVIQGLLIEDLFRQTNSRSLMGISYLTSWVADLQFGFLISEQRRFFSLDYLKARDRNNPIRSLEMNGQVNDQSLDFTIKRLMLDFLDINAKVTGAGNTEKLDLDITLDANGYNYSGKIEGDYINNSWRLISGDVTLVSWNRQETIESLVWNLTEVPFSLESWKIVLTSNGTLNWDSSNGILNNVTAYVSVGIDKLYNLRSLRLEAALSSTNGNDFLIERLSLGDSLGTYQGKGLISFRSLEDFKVDFDIQAAQEGEILLGLSYFDTELTVSGIIKDFDLKRFFLDNFSGKLDTQFLVSFRNSGSISRGNVSIKKAKFGNDPLSAVFSFDYKNNQFRFFEASFTLGNLILDPFTMALDMSGGRFKLETFAKTSFNGIPVNAQITANIETDQEIFFGNNLLGVERIIGNIGIDKIRINNTPQNAFDLNFSKIRSVTTLRGGENNFLLGRFTDDGDFRLVLNKPFPINASIEGKLKDANIEARVQNFFAQADIINFFIPSSLFKILRGTLEADVKIQGFVTDPTFEGNFSVKDIVAQAPNFKGSIGPLSTSISLEGNKFSLPTTQINVGGGKLKIGGDIYLTRLIPDRYRLVVTMDDIAPIGVDYTFSIVRLSGFVSGQMVLEGNLTFAKITGDIELQDSSMLLGIDTAGSGSEFKFPLNIDLVIRSGNRVFLIWPLMDFPIIRAYISPKQFLRYQSDSLQNNFKLLGDVAIRGGEIFYLGQVFYLREGKVSFKEDQNNFDPFVNLLGELRTKDASGPVTVFLTIDDFLSKFTPRFSSSPPKTTEEISTIVGSIFVPDRYTREGWQGALNLVSDVGSGFVLRPFENAIRTTLGLDMFSIRTQILNRFLLTQLSNEPPTLQEYLDNTSIFLGKYIQEDIFFEGMFTLTNQASELYPLSSELRPRLELGLEFQTPFLLIRWNFVPETPSKLFIPDNTINLNWRWTY